MSAPIRTITPPSGQSFDLILVEGGTFRIGSPKGTPDARDSEQPDHEVRLFGFYMGRYPVTRALWEAVMGNNPSRFEGTNRPVEQVSWYDAVAFCNQLSKELGLALCYYSDAGFADPYSISGSLTNEGPVFLNPKAGGFRLPTEAEWEYAARGGKHSEGYKYAGSDRLKQVGWYKENSGLATHDIGLLYPNELGLYDMSGNVWEWCEDQWYDNYWGGGQDGSFLVNRKQGEEGNRIRRGGGWGSVVSGCRVAYRSNWYSSDHNFDLGFRLALSP